jgi:hypothetical protein
LRGKGLLAVTAMVTVAVAVAVALVWQGFERSERVDRMLCHDGMMSADRDPPQANKSLRFVGLGLGLLSVIFAVGLGTLTHER